jgi:hypothetical protein
VLDDLVTLASGFFEPCAVKDNNLAAPIPDKPGLLERSGDERNGCSAHSEHLGQKILGQRKCVRINSIARLQQPSSKPRFRAVNGVACGDLLGLELVPSVKSSMRPFANRIRSKLITF